MHTQLDSLNQARRHTHKHISCSESSCFTSSFASVLLSLTTFYNNNTLDWGVYEGVCVFCPTFSQCIANNGVHSGLSDSIVISPLLSITSH